MDISAPSTDNTTNHQQRISQTLLAIIMVILVGAALKLTAAVTFPLVFALFLTAIFWPLQRRFAQHMPRGAAVVLSLLAFLLVVSVFVGLLWLSGMLVVQGWQPYSEQFTRYQQQAQDWLQSSGLSLPNAGGASGSALAQPALTNAGQYVGSFLGTFVLVLGFLVFGLLETPDFQTRLEHLLPAGKANDWVQVIHDITNDFQRYIVVRTLVGLITAHEQQSSKNERYGNISQS
jgi:predicted PurR-regulated permease PerM